MPVFQIWNSETVLGPNGQAQVNNIPWHTRHGTWDPEKTRRFSCFVRLALITPDLALADIETVVRGYQPEQGNTQTYNNVEWSCARWVIKIIEDLDAQGWIEMDDAFFEEDKLYRRVLACGAKAESSGIHEIDLITTEAA
jgi:hypothetical protein